MGIFRFLIYVGNCFSLLGLRREQLLLLFQRISEKNRVIFAFVGANPGNSVKNRIISAEIFFMRSIGRN